jgi:holo-[acyl-carrier protein] synthase
MVVGVGIDLVDVVSFKTDAEGSPTFLQEVFSETERRYCFAMAEPYQSFAARFAAKEAVMKALGTGSTDSVNFSDIIINIDETGPPYVSLQGGAAEAHAQLGSPRIHVSLTHLRSIASAVVILDHQG